jgi:hypothetical protein
MKRLGCPLAFVNLCMAQKRDRSCVRACACSCAYCARLFNCVITFTVFRFVMIQSLGLCTLTHVPASAPSPCFILNLFRYPIITTVTITFTITFFVVGVGVMFPNFCPYHWRRPIAICRPLHSLPVGKRSGETQYLRET